jgi:hypothetical protein
MRAGPLTNLGTEIRAPTSCCAVIRGVKVKVIVSVWNGRHLVDASGNLKAPGGRADDADALCAEHILHALDCAPFHCVCDFLKGLLRPLISKTVNTFIPGKLRGKDWIETSAQARICNPCLTQCAPPILLGRAYPGLLVLPCPVPGSVFLWLPPLPLHAQPQPR